MKTRRTTHAVALLVVSFCLSAACLAKDSATKPDEAGARAANQARFDAAVRGDTAALDKLLADDLDYCHSNGDCESKRVYLDSMSNDREDPETHGDALPAHPADRPPFHVPPRITVRKKRQSHRL